jgi:hypothetical protein
MRWRKTILAISNSFYCFCCSTYLSDCHATAAAAAAAAVARHVTLASPAPLESLAAASGSHPFSSALSTAPTSLPIATSLPPPAATHTSKRAKQPAGIVTHLLLRDLLLFSTLLRHVLLRFNLSSNVRLSTAERGALARRCTLWRANEPAASPAPSYGRLLARG